MQMISRASFSTAFISGVKSSLVVARSSASSELMRHRNSSLNSRIRNDARRPIRSSALLTITSRATSGGFGGSTRVRLRTSTAVADTR
jgi:hypothetical protein